MKKPTIFGAAAYLTVGQVAAQGLSFARNLLLARYLTKSDFGLAAAFALTIALMELTGRLALGTQVVVSTGCGSFQRCFGLVVLGIHGEHAERPGRIVGFCLTGPHSTAHGHGAPRYIPI